MTEECDLCGSLNFPEERVSRGHFTICCSHGKTRHLPSFDEPGPVLRQLLTSHDARARSFRNHIRSYNAALSFMSVGAKVVAPPGVGPPVYKVHGSICHWTGGLLPAAGEDPVYAQLYIYDPAEALQTRMSHNPEARAETMEALQEELAAENYYAQSYRHMLVWYVMAA
jgi:mono/diheme cytochrome c family protein